jgi:hypothetical protein
MEQQYLQELFSFQAALKQFNNTGGGIFQMEPTEEGAKTLGSYGLHFKPKTDGFAVVVPCIKHDDTGLLELKNRFSDGVKLSFAVFSSDPHLFEYAELPEDPPGEYVYYFNNLNENERKTRLLLLNNCGVMESERVRLHTKQFSGIIARNVENQIITPGVFDYRGNQIPKSRYDLTLDEMQNTYSLDLSRLADGLYTIEYNMESTVYYCAKASFIRRIPLLILEIFVEPFLAEQYRVVRLENEIQYIDAKQFSLYFGDYSNYWRYKIIPVDISPSTWLRVLTNNSAYTFSPEKIKMNSSKDTAIFTSQQAIDASNDGLTIHLYRLDWNGECRLAVQKYKYCNQDYWIEINNDYCCRYKDSNGNYCYQCPARSADQLLGSLPRPGEGAVTRYYQEDGKQFAEMTVYLVMEEESLVVRNTI